MFYLFFPLICLLLFRCAVARALFVVLLLTFVAIGPYARAVLARGNPIWGDEFLPRRHGRHRPRLPVRSADRAASAAEPRPIPRRATPPDYPRVPRCRVIGDRALAAPIVDEIYRSHRARRHHPSPRCLPGYVRNRPAREAGRLVSRAPLRSRPPQLRAILTDKRHNPVAEQLASNRQPTHPRDAAARRFRRDCCRGLRSPRPFAINPRHWAAHVLSRPAGGGFGDRTAEPQTPRGRSSASLRQ